MTTQLFGDTLTIVTKNTAISLQNYNFYGRNAYKRVNISAIDLSVNNYYTSVYKNKLTSSNNHLPQEYNLDLILTEVDFYILRNEINEVEADLKNYNSGNFIAIKFIDNYKADYDLANNGIELSPNRPLILGQEYYVHITDLIKIETIGSNADKLVIFSLTAVTLCL